MQKIRIAITVLVTACVLMLAACEHKPEPKQKAVKQKTQIKRNHLTNKPVCIDLPAGDEKWELIKQYVKDNYGTPIKAEHDTYIVSDWIVLGRDENTEYRKQIRIWPTYPACPDKDKTRVQIIVAIEKQYYTAPEPKWKECGYDADEQERIARELKSILN